MSVQDQCSNPPPKKADGAEEATDPGLIILYNAAAVHTALGQANSPVPQGGNIDQSLTAFKQYVYTQIMLTPCSEEEHCLEKPTAIPNMREFYPEVFHRLPTDTFRNIVERLKRVFIHSGQATAQWSVNVSVPAHVPNSVAPNEPLGVLMKVQGGVGTGQVIFERVAIPHGIFRA